MSSENRDNEGDLIDFHVASPVLPRTSLSVQTYAEASDNLIDTELPILEQKLQTASQTINPIADSRRTSVDVEEILITIDDDVDEVDAPQRVSDNFLNLCDNNLVENLEALSVLKNLDDVLNASLLDSDAGLPENGEEAVSIQAEQDIEACLKDLDNYLKALDSGSSEDSGDSSNESSSSSCNEEQPSTRSAVSSSDLTENHSLADAPETTTESTDEESLRNKLRQMEENYTKFLASGCINRGYVDTETNESERRPLSACGVVNDALNKKKQGRATVAVVSRERPSLHRVIDSGGKPRCASERTSGAAGDSDEDIDWSWLQDIARDVTLERRAHAAGDCCTGTVVVEPPRSAKSNSSSEPAMNEEPKEDGRGSTWLRSSMRHLRHLRLPSNETPPETADDDVTPNVTTEAARLEPPQSTTTTRPVSAPSRLPPSVVRTSTRSSRSRSRESRRSAVSHEPSGRARSSSASSRSRRPRSLSSSESSLASSVDSTPSCTPAASPTQNTQQQPTSAANTRRYAFLVAGIFYGATRLKALQIKESSLKEYREQQKAEKIAKLAEERRAASQRDIDQIIAIFTPKPEPKFTVEEQSYKEEDLGQKEEAASDVQNEVSEVTPELTGLPGNTCEADKNRDKTDGFGSSGGTEQCDIFSNTILRENESINDYPPDDVQAGFGAAASSDATDFGGDNVNFGDTSEVNNADFGDSGENNTFGASTESNNENFGAETLTEAQSDGPTDNEGVDGYFIQSFPDGIPYIGSERDTYHYPKSRPE